MSETIESLKGENSRLKTQAEWLHDQLEAMENNLAEANRKLEAIQGIVGKREDQATGSGGYYGTAEQVPVKRGEEGQA